MHAVENILIVGAGMCGMSLGVALKRAGINCEIRSTCFLLVRFPLPGRVDELGPVVALLQRDRPPEAIVVEKADGLPEL